MNLQINFQENAINEKKIVNKFYQPVKSVIDFITKKCEENKYEKILDIGPGYLPFSKATHFIDHFPDQFRRVLKVCIHDDDGIGTGVIKARCHCRLVTKIAGKLNDADAIVGNGAFQKNFCG